MHNKRQGAAAFIAAALALVAFSGVAAHAAQVYIPLGQPSNAVDTGGFVGGARFERASTADPVTFNSLGFIDLHTVNPTLQGPDGISGTYQVSLWRIDTYTGPTTPETWDWTLLASTTITPASPLGDGPSDTFRYNSIPATTINPGEHFIIGATLPTGPLPDKWLNGTNPVNITGFIGPGSGYTLSSGIFSSAGSPLYIANASTQIIPEPTAAGIVLSLGCLAALLRRRP